jgi:2-phosphosulfolactate phosphatase
MEISIHSLLEGATRATGSVAVIDVFRAFTSAAVALANGASKIVMVCTVKEALELRQAGIGEICVGEVRGRAPDGFDFGNSPYEISGIDFGGKMIIQRTSAGTRGLSRRQTKPNGSTRLPWSRQRQTVRALLSASPDQVPSSLWGTTASREPMRTSCARSTFGTAWKAEWVMGTPLDASS